MACMDDLTEQSSMVAKLYCRLMDTQRSQLVHHLAENARFDWFGHTLVGQRAILTFLHEELYFTKHHLESVFPIGSIECQTNKDTSAASEPQSRDVDARPVTPDNKIPRPWDNKDGNESLKQLALVDSEYYMQITKICHAPRKPRVKRFHYDRGASNRDCEVPASPLGNLNQYLEAVGVLSFMMKNSSPSTAKMLKSSTEEKSKKDRNFKVQLEYVMIGNAVQLSLIVYHDNMPCRKKLVFPHESDGIMGSK